jgi:hypothetical protein
MDYNETYSFALKQTLNEMQNICPSITNAFIYSKDGKILIGDKNTNEEIITQVMEIVRELLEKGEALGDIESINLEGENGGVNLFYINNLYLVSITSGKTNSNDINTLNRIIVPTILALLEKISSTSPIKEQSYQHKEEDIKDKVIKSKPENEINKEIKINQPKSPVNQLTIETLKGIFVSSDTVRIDSELLSEWKERFPSEEIEMEIETLKGKKSRCKVEEIRSKKNKGKGIILVPAKIQKNLDVKNGELVKVRPILKKDEEKEMFELEMSSLNVGSLESYPVFL